MEDLAFLGLDLIESLDAGPVDVIGHGFGGWVAAEMAVRSQQHIRRLALIDSVGIKVSAPTVRDVQDVYVYTAEEVAELAWHDAAAAKVLRWPGMEGVEGEELLALLRNRQSVLKFAWRPFMYNPKLLAASGAGADPDPRVLGRERPGRDPGLRTGAPAGHPGRRLHRDTGRGPLPAVGAAGSPGAGGHEVPGKLEEQEDREMLAYHFTEMPYPFLPDDVEERHGAMRVTLPSRYCDPKIAHDLYNRYLDEYEYADELGLEIMLNEHHATATCMAANVSITAATLVRRTKRAKLLVLGFPLAHRSPIQVAEDAAMLDVMSGVAASSPGSSGAWEPRSIPPTPTPPTPASGCRRPTT